MPDQHVWAFSSGDEVDFSGSLRANGAVTLVNAAIAGMGIARLPIDLAELYLKSGDPMSLPEVFNLSAPSVLAVFLSRKLSATGCAGVY